MEVGRDIVARMLVWLAVIALPAQGLPAGSCGCASCKTCCEQQPSQNSCCSTRRTREARCCASRGHKSAHSCCSDAGECGASACPCGATCDCGKTDRQDRSTLPVENTYPTKNVPGDVLTTISSASSYQLPDTRLQQLAPGDSKTPVALDRCISFCRFTL